MNKEEYLQLIEKYPNLTAHGFGVQVDPRSGLSYVETFEIEREELKGSYMAFCYAWDWFQCQEHIRPRRAACFWKVDIENDLSRDNTHTYMLQGAVILVALYLGYEVHRIRGSVGARIGKRGGEGGMSKNAKRVLALLNEPKHTNRRLASLNESTLDDGAATVGKGDQEIKVLK